MGKLNEYPDADDLTGEEKIVIEQSLHTHSIELNKIVDDLELLKDVDITNATNDEVLIYQNGSWINDTLLIGDTWIIHTTTAANEGLVAIINNKYMIDTSASTANITITIPSANLGDTITVNDMKKNFEISGSKNVITNVILFEGGMDYFEFDVSDSSIQLIYTDSSYGWKQVIK